MASFIRDLYQVLTPQERKSLRSIEHSLKQEQAELETGRLLLKARNLLQPYGSFMRWLGLVGMNYRTAVRRMDAYSGRVDEIINSPELITKECFRCVETRLPRLRESEREQFCDNLVGMMMTMMGMSAPKEFHPKEIPAHFPLGMSREKSPEVREKIAASARARWERVRSAREQ